jgi:hypothetical protein
VEQREGQAEKFMAPKSLELFHEAAHPDGDGKLMR